MQHGLGRREFLGVAGAAAAAAAANAADAPEAPKGVKIVGISCSPRKGKTTSAAVQICLDAAKAVSPSVEVELIELAGLAIPGSVAAGVALPTGHSDDFPSLVPKLTDPRVGGIIIGTPVYFGSMSSLCKAFLDRWVAFRKDFALSNKVAGVVAVGGMRNGGQELTIAAVQAALLPHEMVLVGDGRPTAHRGATLWNNAKDDITKDEIGVSTARSLGRRVAEVALRLAGTARL